MPPNYTIAADIVDIRKDIPNKNDVFFVDTNVWFWTTYINASSSFNPNKPKYYQSNDYPNYITYVGDNDGKIFTCGLSLTELAHLIEKTEFEILKASNNSNCLSLKEFRHNCSEERRNVCNEIKAAWNQVKTLSNCFGISIDQHFTQSALISLISGNIDGYDSFILEAMSRQNISQIITDDGDFSTVPGIKMFTANKTVIEAAIKQKKLLTR